MANNNNLYNAACAGAISAISSRWITSLSGSSYNNQLLSIQAFANQVDALIPAGSYSESAVRTLESMCNAFWANRDPKSTSMSTYLSAAGPLVALWNQALGFLLPETGGVPFDMTNVVYVDPTSPNANYTTLQAAINAEFAAGRLNVLFEISPNVVFTENLSFPNGCNYEIKCNVGTGGFGLGGRITGNISITGATTQTVVSLSNISLTGTITGDTTAAAGSFLTLYQSKVSGDITLTSVGGFWILDCIGAGDTFFSLSGNMSGNVTVAGQLQATYCDSTPARTWRAGIMFLGNVRLPQNIILDGTSVRAARMLDCLIPVAPITITGDGGTATVTVDAATKYEFDRTNSVLATATMTEMLMVTPTNFDSVPFGTSQVRTGLIITPVYLVAGVNDAPLQMPFKWRWVDCFLQTTTAGAGGSVAQWKTATGGGGSNISTTMATSSTTAIARNGAGGNLAPNQIVAANTDIFLNKTDNAAAGICLVQAMRVD